MTANARTNPMTSSEDFARPAPTARPNPSKLRQAGVMLLAVYPLITVLLYVVLPLTEGWAIWERTLIIAPIMVVSIVYVVVPQVQKHLGWFIARLPRPGSR